MLDDKVVLVHLPQNPIVKSSKLPSRLVGHKVLRSSVGLLKLQRPMNGLLRSMT